MPMITDGELRAVVAGLSKPETWPSQATLAREVLDAREERDDAREALSLEALCDQRQAERASKAESEREAYAAEARSLRERYKDAIKERDYARERLKHVAFSAAEVLATSRTAATTAKPCHFAPLPSSVTNRIFLLDARHENHYT